LNLFNTARSCLPCMLLASCCIYRILFRKGMLLRASSPVFECFCSTSFVPILFLFFPAFLLLFPYLTVCWAILVLRFLFIVLVFCKFLHFPFFQYLVPVTCCNFCVFESFSFGLDWPRPLKGGSPSQSWAHGADTYMAVRHGRLGLTSCSLLPSPRTAETSHLTCNHSPPHTHTLHTACQRT